MLMSMMDPGLTKGNSDHSKQRDDEFETAKGSREVEVETAKTAET